MTPTCRKCGQPKGSHDGGQCKPRDVYQWKTVQQLQADAATGGQDCGPALGFPSYPWPGPGIGPSWWGRLPAPGKPYGEENPPVHSHKSTEPITPVAEEQATQSATTPAATERD